MDDDAAARGLPAGGGYNELPYVSMPIVTAQPAGLAAIASLHGIEPPPADRAQVLELDCASGGHIIPLAARFPNARFLGLDLSETHVDDARRRIAELGLANIEIRQGDIATESFAGRQFDYVICHGVFSLISITAQNAIFRICRETLTPDGMAAIRYNVLPGWHQRRIVRDICLKRVGTEGPPRDRVEKARRILEELTLNCSGSDPYGLLLRSEAERLRTVPGSYILGEFLAPHNEPCYFRDFVTRARECGLDYLSECDLPSCQPETLAPRAAESIRAMAGADPAAVQQYTDYFSGRTFRRSMLVRQQAASGAPRTARHERLASLHMAGYFKIDGTKTQADVAVFTDYRKRSIEVKHRAMRETLVRLGECFPGTVPVETLLSGIPGGDGRRGVSEALFQLIATGRATVSSLPLRVGSAGDERPRVWPIARAEAAAGQPWVTSLGHRAVIVNKVLAFLLPHLDGSNDRRMLLTHLASTLRSGQVEIPELKAGRSVRSQTRLDDLASEYLSRSLAYLAANALLERGTALRN